MVVLGIGPPGFCSCIFEASRLSSRGLSISKMHRDPWAPSFTWELGCVVCADYRLLGWELPIGSDYGAWGAGHACARPPCLPHASCSHGRGWFLPQEWNKLSAGTQATRLLPSMAPDIQQAELVFGVSHPSHFHSPCPAQDL